MFSPDLLQLSQQFLALCRERGLKVCTAESCTGGLVSALLTEIAGSSDVVDRGFVTYSNRAKVEELGVSGNLLRSFGAVSEETARAMAEGALSASLADIAVAVTGIAGPGGGSPEKPVGLVYLACARKGSPTVAARYLFPGESRSGIRMAAVRAAVELAMNQAEAAGVRRVAEGAP
jgi:nicotinamide-nucleotide amidase